MSHLIHLLALYQTITNVGILWLSQLPQCSDTNSRFLIETTALKTLSNTNDFYFERVYCGVFPFSLLCPINLADQIHQSEIMTKDNTWGDIVLKSGGFNSLVFSYLSLWRNVAAFHPSIATVFSGLPLSVTKTLVDTCDRLTLQVLINKFPQTIMLSGTNFRLFHERRDFTNISLVDHINNIRHRKSQKEIKESRILLASRMLMPNIPTENMIYADENPETVFKFLAEFGLGYRSIANVAMHSGFLGYRDACRMACRYVSTRQDEPQVRTIWGSMSIRDQDQLIAYVDDGLSRVRHSPADVCRAFPAACLQAAAILELPLDPKSLVGLMRSIATELHKRMDVA